MTLKLNTLKPASGAHRSSRRVGRGGGSRGKTSGRGHKGQRARSGYSQKVGFEGGQTPLQQRLPKVGFTSRKASFRDEVRLSELNRITENEIDLETLKRYNLVSGRIRDVKIILQGTVERAITIKHLRVTKGARKLIESMGGRVED